MNHLEQRKVRQLANTRHTSRTPQEPPHYQQTWWQPLGEVYSAPDSTHSPPWTNKNTGVILSPSVGTGDLSHGYEETVPNKSNIADAVSGKQGTHEDLSLLTSSAMQVKLLTNKLREKESNRFISMSLLIYFRLTFTSLAIRCRFTWYGISSTIF